MLFFLLFIIIIIINIILAINITIKTPLVAVFSSSLVDPSARELGLNLSHKLAPLPHLLTSFCGKLEIRDFRRPTTEKNYPLIKAQS